MLYCSSTIAFTTILSRWLPGVTIRRTTDRVMNHGLTMIVTSPQARIGSATCSQAGSIRQKKTNIDMLKNNTMFWKNGEGERACFKGISPSKPPSTLPPSRSFILYKLMVRGNLLFSIAQHANETNPIFSTSWSSNREPASHHNKSRGTSTT